MPEPSVTVLVILLVAYGAGILWVIGLLWVTVMKYGGWIEIERPRWLFGSLHRAMGVCLLSAAAVIAFDRVIRSLGVL